MVWDCQELLLFIIFKFKVRIASRVLTPSIVLYVCASFFACTFAVTFGKLICS